MTRQSQGMPLGPSCRWSFHK